MSKSIQELSDRFAQMPGIGPRQARRIVQFLLRSNDRYKKELATHIQTIAETVSQCSFCHKYDEVNSDLLCVLCADKNRDITSLFVVEKDVDVDGIESAGVHHGKYFVLGGLIPISQNRKSAVDPRTHLLYRSIKENPTITEVILGFATTPEGDNTARDLRKEITRLFPTTTVSLLGRGLSLGAEIEYADQETIRSAFQGRN